MKGFAGYALACLVVAATIGVVGWSFAGPGGQQAVLASALLALGIQVIAFLITRQLQHQNLMLGWGIGSALRLVAVVLYAIIVAKIWRVPVAPALLSFVAILFVTTVFEPLFLRR